MLLAPAVLFYDVVLAVHIVAIVIAFGVTFTYVLTVPFVTRTAPQALPAVHRAQELIAKRLIAPFGGLAFLAGAYLASDRDYWSEAWVMVPLLILVLLLASGGAFFGPHERRAAELAERDLAVGGGGPLGAEYQAVVRRILLVGGVANVLIVVAIFFMTAKPFA